MGNKRRGFGILAAIIVAIAVVGFIGTFAFGWHGGGTSGYGMMDGMYGSWMWGTTNANGEALSNEQAVDAAERYIATYSGTSLELAEVMVFDNQFYAQAQEVETGRYAYEFLIDRFSGRISLEPGPDMMWNEKYGHAVGGMMGFFRESGSSDQMPVTEEEAVTVAQAYLDRYVPALQVDDHAAVFFGYYTLHTLRDGEIVGMLSVNGYSGAIWLHNWHGIYLGEALQEDH